MCGRVDSVEQTRGELGENYIRCLGEKFYGFRSYCADCEF